MEFKTQLLVWFWAGMELTMKAFVVFSLFTYLGLLMTIAISALYVVMTWEVIKEGEKLDG